jgi:uncharacterized protein YqeY
MPGPVTPLQDRISQDMKLALKAGEKQRLGAIRLILAAIKQIEVDTRESLDEPALLALLDKLAKQRRESITQYEQAGRDELAAQERFELELIQAYLPQPLGAAEIETLIDEAVKAAGATGIKDMGRVMGALKPKLQGRADMGAVSAQVKARLSG